MTELTKISLTHLSEGRFRPYRFSYNIVIEKMLYDIPGAHSDVRLVELPTMLYLSLWLMSSPCDT